MDVFPNAQLLHGGLSTRLPCKSMERMTFRNTSKARALGSPSGSFEHRCLFYYSLLL
jgi:hypothetical protein